MRKLWLIPFPFILFGTMASAFFALMYSSWLWVPVVLLGSMLGAGCLEKAAGAGFFPWTWQFKGRPHEQALEGQVARQSARNVKGAKR